MTLSNQKYTNYYSSQVFMYFTVPHISITPSGNSITGGQYQLTCTFITTSNSTTSFSWFGPPNGGILPSGNSDTRTVSDVMSSGFTHTSILQFDPLQSSHEGNYTCQVTVLGTVTEMSSIQINVEGKS